MNEEPEQPNYNPDNNNNIPPSNSDYPIHTPGYPYPTPQGNNYNGYNGMPNPNAGSYQTPPGYINYAPPQPGFPGQMPGYYPPPGYVSPFPYAISGQLPPYGIPGMSNNPATLEKATFWQRVGATLVDAIIFMPVGFVVGIIFSLLSFSTITNTRGLGPGINNGVGITSSYSELSFMASIVSTLPSAIYVLWLVALGQTLGDKAVKIRIVDSDGNRPGFVRSLIRYCVPFIAGLSSSIVNLFYNSTSNNFFNIGSALIILVVLIAVYGFTIFAYLWMLWDSNKQTLFDKLAGTFVVKTL